MSKMQLPHDHEAEKAALCSAFMNDECLDMLCEELESVDFFVPINRLIFDTIKYLVSNSDSVDKVMVNAKLKDNKTYNDYGTMISDTEQINGGLEYLTHLSTLFPPADHIADYIRIIKDCSIRRFAVRICKEMYHELQSNEDTGETIVSRYATKLSDVEPFKENKHWTIPTLNSWEHWLQYKDDLDKYPHWVFKDIQRQLGPLLGYELVVIAAITGVGKTIFSLQDACFKAQNGISVTFYSAELNVESMGKRVFRIETTRKMNDVGEDSRDLVLDIMSKWRDLPLEIIAETRYERISSSIRRMHRQGKCRVAYVDFLQYLTAPQERGENEERLLSKMVRGYASLAKEIGIDIVLVSQFNRNAGATGYPTKKDLRGSGDIENFANIITLLYPPIDKDKRFEGEVWAVNEKNRDGITGARSSLLWNPGQGLFYDRPILTSEQVQERIYD